MKGKKARSYIIHGIISLIMGILHTLLTFFGLIGLIIIYYTHKEIKASPGSLILDIILVSIYFYVGIMGTLKFLPSRGFPFYNSLFIIAYGIFNLGVGILHLINLTTLTITPLTIAVIISLMLIVSISLIMNGAYLLEK
jgi:hypothetical protein